MSIYLIPLSMHDFKNIIVLTTPFLFSLEDFFLLDKLVYFM